VPKKKRKKTKKEEEEKEDRQLGPGRTASAG
jgi:hypothetical protein